MLNGAEPISKTTVEAVPALSNTIPSATGILQLGTAFRDEASENFAMKGRTETDRRAAPNIDQSHAKKERASMARARS